MTTLYENHAQARVLRIVVWFFLAVAVVTIYPAWLIAQWYGLAPGDGGVLKPLSERLALAGFVFGLALAIAAGMMIYATLYTLRLVLSGDDEVLVTTVSPFATGELEYRFKKSDFISSGFFDFGTPWITLRVRGHRFPFILDLNAKTVDYEGLFLMMGGKPDEWDPDVE